MGAANGEAEEAASRGGSGGGGGASDNPDDAEWAADFAEFMDGDAAFERGELPEPDPLFRERLHRRLWRTHVIINLRDGGETH